MARIRGTVWGCLRLFVLPVVIFVVAGLILLAVHLSMQKKPALSIISSRRILTVTNDTDEVLTVRVAYRHLGLDGDGYCYPDVFDYSLNGKIPELQPNRSRTYLPDRCAPILKGYIVWAWNKRGEMVAEIIGTQDE